MELFWKAAVAVILTVILGVTIGKTERDISVALTATACCIVLMIGLQYLSEVIAFLWRLGAVNEEPASFWNTLLNISGVALMTELTGLISSDAGNHSLAKAMEILGNAAVLYLSLPVFETFFAMIQDILKIL